MAPMAGGVTDAYQDELIFVLCFLQCFGAPGIPVNGVIGMLQQVWGCRIGETVHSSLLTGKIANITPINLYQFKEVKVLGKGKEEYDTDLNTSGLQIFTQSI
jgi:hypothetical protein